VYCKSGHEWKAKKENWTFATNPLESKADFPFLRQEGIKYVFCAVKLSSAISNGSGMNFFVHLMEKETNTYGFYINQSMLINHSKFIKIGDRNLDLTTPWSALNVYLV
jgi:hypothetical protein